MHGKGERKGASQERGPSPQERAAQQTRPHCWPLGAGRPWALLGWGGRAGVGAEPLPAGRSSELLLCGPRGAQGVGAMDGRPHERGDPCGRGWCKVARVGAQPGGERHGGARCLGAGSESSPPLRMPLGCSHLGKTVPKQANVHLSVSNAYDREWCRAQEHPPPPEAWGLRKGSRRKEAHSKAFGEGTMQIQ